MVHKRCSGIRGKLKEDRKFKCRTSASQQIVIAGGCPSIELNDHSLEIVETFFYLGDSVGARGGAFDSTITIIRSGWCKLEIKCLC